MKTLVTLFSILLSSAAMSAPSVRADVSKAAKRFEQKDPAMKTFFDNAAGYAIFPNVGKGGFIVGAAHGTGQVFEDKKLVGSAELFQASIGLQAGGQEFSEIIFFKTKEALKAFQSSQWVVAAEVSAVVAAEGAAAKAKYHDDVAIFVLPKGGVMVEAAIGGQKFQYKAN